MDMMNKVKNIFARLENQLFIAKYNLGYDFITADAIITEDERGAHNPNCWIRAGVRVGDQYDTRFNATPFLVWLQATTEHHVGNFRVRYTLNAIPTVSSGEAATAGLKEIRHRITHGEVQRYDPFPCQRDRITHQEPKNNSNEGCTRKADPGSLYCVQCRPKNLSMHEKEVTRNLQLDDAEAQQFEVKLAPSVTLVIQNPFLVQTHHNDSIVELSTQINQGEISS